MATNMIEKFTNYWSQTNGTLAIASIVDPRNKMDYVDWYFRRIYNEGLELALERIRGILGHLLAQHQ